MDIKENVRHLVKKHQTNNPFKIAKELDIIIVYENLGDILGYYSKSHRFQVIHINENSSEEQQVFTCAHELGHAILHPYSNSSFLKSSTFFSADKLEIEANTFAVELMLSREVICPITIHEAVENYGIPEQLLIKKFYA